MKKAHRHTARAGSATENAACKAMLVAAEPKINALLDEIRAGGLDVAVVVTDPLYRLAHDPISPADEAAMRASVEDAGGVPLVLVLPIETVEGLLAEHQTDVSDRIVRGIQRDRDPAKIQIVYALGPMFGRIELAMPAAPAKTVVWAS